MGEPFLQTMSPPLMLCSDIFLSSHSDGRLRLWRHGIDAPVAGIAYQDCEGRIIETPIAALGGSAYFLGMEKGWIAKIPIGCPESKPSFLKLPTGAIVHTSLFEGCLVACSERQVAIIILTRWEVGSYQLHVPFRDEMVKIQKSRVVKVNGHTKLLVAGLRAHRQLSVLVVPWRTACSTTSAWQMESSNSNDGDFIIQDGGNVVWPFRRCVEEILGITYEGLIAVRCTDGTPWHFDLETQRVEYVGLTDPYCCPDSTSDRGPRGIRVCPKDLQLKGSYFASGKPQPSGRLERLPTELLRAILQQVGCILFWTRLIWRVC